MTEPCLIRWELIPLQWKNLDEYLVPYLVFSQIVAHLISGRRVTRTIRARRLRRQPSSSTRER